MTAPKVKSPGNEQKRLGPIYIEPDLDARIQREWSRMCEAFGSQVPKATLIRAALHRGLDVLEGASWIGVREASQVLERIEGEMKETARLLRPAKRARTRKKNR